MSNLIEKRNRIREAVPHLATASGSIASFQTDMKSALEEIKIHFNPQQASGTPSPSNPIPIYGWTGCDIFIRSRNLLQVTANTKTQAGVKWTVNSDGTITVNGTATGYSSLSIGRAIVEGIKDKTVCISGLSGTTNIVWDTFNLYDKNDNQIASLTISSASNRTIDLSQYSGVHRIAISAKRASNVATSGTIRPKVEFGSTATSYEPFVGNQIPVSWSALGTVYSGWVNPVSGEVWAEWASNTISNYRVGLNSNADNAWWNWHIYPDSPAKNDFQTSECLVMCDSFKAIPQSQLSRTDTTPIVWMANVSTSYPIRFKYISDCALTAEQFKEKYKDVRIAYKLATPVLVGTISPITLKTLVGQNNIWSNANGNVDVRYWKH